MNKGEGQRGKRPVSRAERMRRKRERLKRRRRIAIAILCGMVLLLILIIVGIVALVRHFAGGSDTGDKNQGQASDLTRTAGRRRAADGNGDKAYLYYDQCSRGLYAWNRRIFRSEYKPERLL